MVVLYKAISTKNLILTVFDAQGKLVLSESLNLFPDQQSIKIPLSSTFSGSIYMVNLRTNSSSNSVKFIVNK